MSDFVWPQDSPWSQDIAAKAMEMALHLSPQSSIGERVATLGKLAVVLDAAGDPTQAHAAALTAAATAATIPGVPARSQALAVAAQSLVKIGHQDEAEELALQALALTQHIGDADTMEHIFRPVAIALAQTGAFDQALQLTQNIASEWVKASTLGEMAVALAKVGDLRRALTTAATIEISWDKTYSLAQIAVATAQRSQPGQSSQALWLAMEAVRTNPIEWHRRIILREIATFLEQSAVWSRSESIEMLHKAVAQSVFSEWAIRSDPETVAVILAHSGTLDQVETVVQQIANPGARAFCVAQCAQSLAQAGARERATLYADRAILIADQFYREQNVGTLGQIAVALAPAVQEAWQRERVLSWLEAVQNAPTDDKVRVLANVALALVQMGEMNQARELAQQASALVSDFSAEWGENKKILLGNLAIVLTYTGDINSALQNVRTIADKRAQIVNLGKMIDILVRSGRSDATQQVIWLAFEATDAIVDVRSRASAWEALSIALARAGIWEEAGRAAKLAIEATDAIVDVRSRASDWEALSIALARAGIWEEAGRAAKLAIETAQNIAEPYAQVSALAALVESLGQVGLTTQAHAAALAVLEIAETLTHYPYGIGALDALAAALARTMEPELTEPDLILTLTIAHDIREVPPGLGGGEEPETTLNLPGTAASAAQSQAEAFDGRDAAPTTPPSGERYLNAGLFLKGGSDPLPSEQPLRLVGEEYRLGINIGPHWGLSELGAPIPDVLLQSFFADQTTLEIDLRVTALDVVIEPPEAKLLLPRIGSSLVVFFDLLFLRTGRHAIEIDLLFHGHLLQSLEVKVYVVDDMDKPLPPDAMPVQAGRVTFARTGALKSDTLHTLENRPSRLTVVVQRLPTSDIELRLYDTTGVVGAETGCQRLALTEQALTSLLLQVRIQLEEVMDKYVGGIGGDLDMFRASVGKLAEIGSSFYRALFEKPARIGARQATPVKLDLVSGQIIQVTPLSSQIGVPWELLYERPIESYDEQRISLCPSWREHGPDPRDCPGHGDPSIVCPYGFWGYRYIIEQLPYRLDPSTPPHGRPLVLQIRNSVPLQLSAIVYSAFQLLDRHLSDLQQLTPAAQLSVSRIASKDGVRLALTQAVHPPDVLYFYTHGGLEGDAPVLVIGQGEHLKENDLVAWRIDLTRRRPLVLLNACKSAAYTPNQFENLIQTFCDGGAAGVIGTQCLVDEPLAAAFILRFFKAFFEQATVGQALFDARLALLNYQKTTGDTSTSWPDPRGLVYSLFAAADITLGRPIQ